MFSVPNPGRDGSEPLITAAPKAGAHVGTWTVAGGERIDTPALKQVDAVRIENFDRDDPQITAERRMKWRGACTKTSLSLWKRRGRSASGGR